MEIGTIVLVDGYKGDGVSRMGRIESYSLPTTGEPTVTLLRSKGGDNGQIRQYHIEGLKNMREVSDTLVNLVCPRGWNAV